MHDAPTRLTDRPWLAFYDPGVPADVAVPDEPLDLALSTAAARFPQRTAIRFFGRSISYRELDELVNRFAQALLARGVQRGERVALLMPNARRWSSPTTAACARVRFWCRPTTLAQTTKHPTRHPHGYRPLPPHST